METYNYDPSSLSSGEAETDNQNVWTEQNRQTVQLSPYAFSEPMTPSIAENSGNNSGNARNTCFSCGSVHGNPSGLLNTILWTWGTFPSTAPQSPISHVRFYNAASIREPLDIYLNGRLVVSDLDYMNYTKYLHIIPGNYLLTVYRKTTPGRIPIINNRVQFQGGVYYLLTILGGPYDYSAQLVTS